MINLYKLLKLSVMDLINTTDIRNISGIWCYVGDFGQGKTLSLVREAYRLKKDGFKVYSNFSLTFRDGYLTHWQDILNCPDNSVICIDEVGETFNSRAWQSMPRQVFAHMIQNRKRNIRFLFTAQEFDDVDKTIRGKTKYVIKCSKYARLIVNKFYTRKTYYRADKYRRCEFKERFVLEDSISNFYNTNEFVEILQGIHKS